MHALAESKMDHTRDMKQDHDQKPNSNLMISMNMGKLSHQVKLEADCDTGNMRMQLHTTSDEVSRSLAPRATGLFPLLGSGIR